MSTNLEDRFHALVGGEPAGALAAAIVLANPEWFGSGDLRADPGDRTELGIALVRALMRVEAELLIRDADHFGDRRPLVLRTPSQRRTAAFEVLMQRLGDVVTA